MHPSDSHSGARTDATRVASRVPQPAAASQATLSIRIDDANPDHHLWRNRGTWWIHFTEHRGNRKHRIRHSLKTKDLVEARARRDAIFRSRGIVCAAEGTAHAQQQSPISLRSSPFERRALSLQVAPGRELPLPSQWRWAPVMSAILPERPADNRRGHRLAWAVGPRATGGAA